jgi:RND family efflux transporter MFP subunit
MDIRKLRERFSAMNKNMIAGIVVITAVLGSGTLLQGGEKGHAAIPRHESQLKAPVVAASSAVIDDVITAAGVLASRNTSVLSSKIMGKVIALSVHEGDQVSEGALLLRIESGEIATQVIQAQAAYNNAKLQYHRIKSLFDAKASTQIEMEQATLGLQTAEAGVKAAKAMESYTVITAPISGQIVERRINFGEMAMPGQPVLRIEDNGRLRLEVTVRESDLVHIRTGQAARVKIDAMPGKDLKGRVSQIVPAADIRTHSFLVKIDIPAERGLITGMYGRAFFSTGRRKTVVIPKSAVVNLAGIKGVYVVGAENRAAFQMVLFGADQGSAVEVLTGLKAGDRVVADNTLGRIEGRTVMEAIQ